MNGQKPRVAVVFNKPFLPHDHPDAVSEADVQEVSRSVTAALIETGFDPILVPAGPPLVDFLAELTDSRADLVFNLIEAFGGSSAAEPHVASIYELLGIAYTGSPVEAIATCRSKALTKALLRGSGLPTASFVVADRGGSIPTFDWLGPVIVKPESEDASLGIDQDSVVTSPDRLAERVERTQQSHAGRVLIESYLPGPEYNIGVIANPEPIPLPVAQVVFADRPGAWPILTYSAKWDTGSSEDLASPIICPAPIESDLAARLGALALAAFRVTGCRDYARVDFRLDRRLEPMILEVNPNPDLGPGAGWARAARCAGIDYAKAVSTIAFQALERGRRSKRR